MAASYVVVSAAAVLFVEAVLLAVMVPRIGDAARRAELAQRSAAEAEAQVNQTKTEGMATLIATIEGTVASTAAGRDPALDDEALLRAAAADGLGEDTGKGPPPIQALATRQGRVIASTLPGLAALPGVARDRGRADLDGHAAHWATVPVEITGPDGSRRTIGVAFAALPIPDGKADDKAPAQDLAVSTAIGPLVMPGAVVLGLLIPVGALFGLLSTGRLIRRIRGLAAGTAAMAGGDLSTRIPVSGDDEVGRLERAFNSMAERLDAAVREQRSAAGQEAQWAERARIARELHDSISQDLFSANLVAGGLRRALPPGSELRAQAESMERSLARTMREMRAMLLELRPIALQEAGLAQALHELCRAYQSRLGIAVAARIDAPPGLSAAAEHAVFRVAQETLSNAIRHGKPGTIALHVAAGDGHVTVTVADDGVGFDPGEAGGRHGMGLQLMRERVGELGGTVVVESAPGKGTTVMITVPRGVSI